MKQSIVFPNGRTFKFTKDGRQLTSSAHYVRDIIADVTRNQKRVVCTNPFHAGAIRPDTQGEIFCSDSCFKLYEWFLINVLPFFDAIKGYDTVVPKASQSSPGNGILIERPVRRLEDLEREEILFALRQTHQNQVKAAELLGISPRAINYKMNLHGIKRPKVHNSCQRPGCSRTFVPYSHGQKYCSIQCGRAEQIR